MVTMANEQIFKEKLRLKVPRSRFSYIQEAEIANFHVQFESC